MDRCRAEDQRKVAIAIGSDGRIKKVGLAATDVKVLRDPAGADRRRHHVAQARVNGPVGRRLAGVVCDEPETAVAVGGVGKTVVPGVQWRPAIRLQRVWRDAARTEEHRRGSRPCGGGGRPVDQDQAVGSGVIVRQIDRAGGRELTRRNHAEKCRPGLECRVGRSVGRIDDVGFSDHVDIGRCEAAGDPAVELEPADRDLVGADRQVRLVEDG